MKVKDILFEATEFVYHYTDLDGWKSIIDSGHIKGFTYEVGSDRKKLKGLKEKPEIATTRDKKINPSLSLGVGPFRFRIHTKFVNKKMKPISELPVEEVNRVNEFYKEEMGQKLSNKKVHDFLTEVSKKFSDHLEKKDKGGYKVKRSTYNDLSRKTPLAKDLADKFLKIESKYFKNIYRDTASERLSYMLYRIAVYYPYAMGRDKREAEERIKTDKLDLNRKYIQFEFLDGAMEEFSALGDKEKIKYFKTFNDMENKVEVVKNKEYKEIKRILTS